MSTFIPAEMRYPLGLPAGSVRSILSIMVIGMFCIIFLIPPEENARTSLPVLNNGYVVIPAYLIGLVSLVIISFLSAYGRSFNRSSGGKRESAPLGLPRWTVVILILAMLIATFAYKINTDLEGLVNQVKATMSAYGHNPWPVMYAALGLFSGYVFGHVLQMIFGADNQMVIYQDLIAWVSILAMVGMLILVLIALVINVNLHEQAPIDLSIFGSVLAGIIAFYYSVRS